MEDIFERSYMNLVLNSATVLIFNLKGTSLQFTAILQCKNYLSYPKIKYILSVSVIFYDKQL